LDGITYTFRTALSVPDRPYEIKIQVSAAVTLDVVKDAVNRTASVGVIGTDYSTSTVAHPTVTATTNTNTTQLFVAKSKGTYGNNFVSVEVGSHTSFGGATFSGGANIVANEVLIGADADGSLTNLKNAVAGGGTAGTDYSETTPVHPLGSFGAVAAHAMVFTLTDYAVTNGDVATTETGAHLSWGASTIASGVAKVVAVAGASTKDTNAGIAGDKNV